MRKFIFTFGVSGLNAKRYQVVRANEAEEARERMVAAWGYDWCTQYTEDEWHSVLQRNERMREYEPLGRELGGGYKRGTL